MIRQNKGVQRVILVAVCTGSESECEESLRELGALADTAGALVCGKLIQKREGFSPATYIGSGKIAELLDLIRVHQVDGIICDDDLTQIQMKNLEEQLECAVCDRTLLILDIFAARAQSSEGKLQVELAQLQYRMTHLAGMGRILSRQGGGIGTRGPGEKKLETDRRMIRQRITHLKGELEEVQRHRDLLRSGRSRKILPVFAIVGYTNAGKSSLLNAMTGAGVLAMDQLFATLDPVTQGMTLPDGQKVLLTDTVGLIRKLPVHLVNAFRSTLEEAKYADIILHVVDSASPRMAEQMYTVYETLSQLGAGDIPVITVMNKQDLCGFQAPGRDIHSEMTVPVSTLTGEGLTELCMAMQELLLRRQILIERRYGYEDAGKIALIRKYGKILKEEYQEDGIYVKAYVTPEIYGNV